LVDRHLRSILLWLLIFGEGPYRNYLLFGLAGLAVSCGGLSKEHFEAFQFASFGLKQIIWLRFLQDDSEYSIAK
jgi:hypothetical protein